MADMSWLGAQYAERKAAAEARVTRWVPCTDAVYAVDPTYFLANRMPVGERLGEGEGEGGDGDGAAYWYGEDDEGRVWVERQGTSFAGQTYETFFIHGPAGPVELALFTYSPDKAAIRHEVFTYEAGRLATAEYQATGGCGRSTFGYEAGRLVRVDDENGPSLGELAPFLRVRVEYDERGEISLVTRGSAVAYRALPAGTSMADVERTFVERMVEAVPAAVAASPPPTVPAGLVLLYTPGQFHVLPPLVALPTGEGDEGIARLLTQHEAHEVWINEEDAPELYELAGYLDQNRLADDRLQTILNEVCRRLNELDWPFDVAGDFLVFAMDAELVYSEESLSAVTTPERTARIIALTME
ncbi:hypothetical protein [Spirillospora sp. NPDC047279]|uniref:hypothetical protein n=1 Tax=Spirillospora sp. NPDC047279 TaxID=3155478 RepID=UPI0033D7099A